MEKNRFEKNGDGGTFPIPIDELFSKKEITSYFQKKLSVFLKGLLLNKKKK